MLELLGIELGRATGDFFGNESLLAVLDEVRYPLKHGTGCDPEERGDFGCRLAFDVHIRRLLADPLLFLAAAGENRAGIKLLVHSEMIT
jgi:hypothetical protein